jgi:hypothetical protein
MELFGVRMLRSINNTIMIALLLLSPLLMGADGGSEGPDERTALQGRHKTLNRRLAALQREEDFLLFQKAMYVSDSKYLVLRAREKTGQLMYKNRVLKDLHFRSSQKISAGTLKPGKLVLTKKVEGKNDRNVLIFEDALIIQWKRDVVPQREKKIPVLSLKKKEMLSVFYALEVGSLAYIIR